MASDIRNPDDARRSAAAAASPSSSGGRRPCLKREILRFAKCLFSRSIIARRSDSN